MSKSEVVSTEVLMKVCKVLHCDVGDIVEFIDDGSENTEEK
jgi:DNA-binding Xre family transcriptional regulator